MNKLIGKLIIQSKIEVITGLHIGTSGDFSAIGAVDNIVIRDSLTNKPMIPGSSLKGKMRYLLERTKYNNIHLNTEDNTVSDKDKIIDETSKIKRLFGYSATNEKDKTVISRLQFQDNILTEDSSEKLKKMDLDLPYTEIKYENTIDRATCRANPRQQERVPAGAEFDFNLTYNVENIEEFKEDMDNIFLMVELLEDDYLGGHGTRGYGRVKFKEFTINKKSYTQENEEELQKIENDIKFLKEELDKKGKLKVGCDNVAQNI